MDSIRPSITGLVKYAMDRSDSFDSLVRSVHSNVLKQRAYFFTWWATGRYYEAPIDPLKLIYIDPSEVTHLISKQETVFSYPKHVSFVADGDWDMNLKPLDQYDLYRGFEAHFLYGVSWEETDWYDRVCQQIESGRTKWGFTSENEFQNRLAELDALYKTIKKQGYLTQREILLRDYEDPINRSERKSVPVHCPELMEVTVVINREGEVLFHDGRNRFSIARILGIDRIPVRVRLRHENWQQHRDLVASSSDTASDRSHPDLQFTQRQ